MTEPPSVLALGVGCRVGCPAGAIVSLVRAVWAAAAEGEPAALFTIADKLGDAGLAEAASLLGVPLHGLPHAALAAVADRTVTASPATAARFAGLPSIAEAAALAGAGPGAVLLVPRRAANGATCAAARRGAA